MCKSFPSSVSPEAAAAAAAAPSDRPHIFLSIPDIIYFNSCEVTGVVFTLSTRLNINGACTCQRQRRGKKKTKIPVGNSSFAISGA